MDVSIWHTLTRTWFVLVLHVGVEAVSSGPLLGVREQWVGDQYWGRRQLWWAGSHIRDPKSSHSKSEDQREAVGHRQGQLQENTYGEQTDKDSNLQVSATRFSSWLGFVCLFITSAYLLSLQGSTLRKRKMYEEFLRKVSILGEMICK